MPEAHQLQVFLTAAETLNFTKTAKMLHLSQPTVSQHIQSLEKYFGTKLFHRHGRTIELSDSGKTLIPLAKDLVKVSTHIKETMDSLKGEVFGHLIVGCSTTPGKYILPLILAQFHQKFPQVILTCKVFAQKNAIEKLCSGEVNLALTSVTKENAKDAEFIKFYTDQIVLIAHVDHPFSNLGEVETDDLLSAEFIMREESSGTNEAVNKALRSVDLSLNDFNKILTLGNSEAIALSVQENLGVGFVSKMIVDKICSEDVKIIKIKGLEITRDIYLSRQLYRHASSAQNAFWNIFSQTGFPLTEEKLKNLESIEISD
jgi:DNA-binding transcriptional LysR family regulator